LCFLYLTDTEIGGIMRKLCLAVSLIMLTSVLTPAYAKWPIPKIPKVPKILPSSSQVPQVPQEPQEPIYTLPFGVKVGGQEAVVIRNDNTWGTIADAVSSDALLEIDSRGDSIIINVFPSNEKGDASGDAAIILVQDGGNTVRLDQTKDKRMEPTRLQPGLYLMNVVAGSNTSRVMFRVK
jgi:hypothetical protein